MYDVKKELQLFNDNRQSVVQINRSLLKLLLIVASAVCVVVTVFCFFMDGYNSLKITYLLMSVFSLAVLGIQRIIPDRFILLSFYFLFLVLMGYASYSSAVLFPETEGVFALGVMIVIPTLILDKSPRIYAVMLITMVAYLCIVIPLKQADHREDEIVYIITFTIVGLMLGSYLRRLRLENLELLRESKIRETTDVLTGLYNRRKLFEYFAECESGCEEKPVTGISMLDIDFFKSFNDTYGHLAGDDCLRAIGACLKDYGAKHDMEFYRYGGEELVAIAHEKDTERLSRSFEYITNSIAILQIPHKGNNSGIVTVSQGVFLLPPDSEKPASVSSEDKDKGHESNHLNGFRAQQYLSKADEALYQAKEQGRNKTVFVQ